MSFECERAQTHAFHSGLMKLAPLAAAVLVASGCKLGPAAEVVFATRQVESATRAVCQELRAFGHIESLRRQVRADMARIHKLLESRDLLAQKETIIFLSRRIQANAVSMTQIADPKYTTEQTEQHLKWKLGAYELMPPVGETSGFWEVRKVELEDVFNWQGRNEALKSLVRIEADEMQVSVELKKPASYLELCQLQQTIVVVLRVELQDLFGSRTVMRYELVAPQDQMHTTDT